MPQCDQRIRLSRCHALWTALGLAGSVLVAYCAPRAVDDAVVGWWYVPAAPGGRELSIALVYAGIAALVCAWLGLGLGRAQRLPSERALMVIGALWLVPLALAPPLFSRDVYSYLAQGTILHLGHSPYQLTPQALAALGHPHLLAAVSPFWRHTTAPYGPLFLELISLIVGIAGSHLVAGVLLTRVLELAGVALLAISIPRLARSLGSDRRRALWLTLLSPLLALGLIAPAHNDVLMVGLLVAGVAVALDGRPLLGIAICALAATIKLPALAGAAFIAVAWAREERGSSEQARFLIAGTAVAGAVLGIVTIATGVGLSWISTAVFSTPAKVHLAITPSTGLGWTMSSLASDIGIASSRHGVESAFGVVALAITVAAGLGLLYRVRIARLVPYRGAFRLVAAAGGPAAWPWYFAWGLTLIAACRRPQRSPALAVAICVSVFLVKPDGILALPLDTAPVIVCLYGLIAVATWLWWRREDNGPPGGRQQGSEPRREGSQTPASALVRT